VPVVGLAQVGKTDRFVIDRPERGCRANQLFAHGPAPCSLGGISTGQFARPGETFQRFHQVERGADDGSVFAHTEDRRRRHWRALQGGENARLAQHGRILAIADPRGWAP
jgi:hypothetical protein